MWEVEGISLTHHQHPPLFLYRREHRGEIEEVPLLPSWLYPSFLGEDTACYSGLTWALFFFAQGTLFHEKHKIVPWCKALCAGCVGGASSTGGLGQVMQVSSFPLFWVCLSLSLGQKVSPLFPAEHVCHPEASACKRLTSSPSFTLSHFPLLHMTRISEMASHHIPYLLLIIPWGLSFCHCMDLNWQSLQSWKEHLMDSSKVSIISLEGANLVCLNSSRNGEFTML